MIRQCDETILHAEHYHEVSWCLKSPETRLFVQQIVYTNSKENTKVPHYRLFVANISISFEDRVPIDEIYGRPIFKIKQWLYNSESVPW